MDNPAKNIEMKTRIAEILDMEPAAMGWATETEFMASLVRQILTGRTAQTPEVREILNSGLAVEHLAKILIRVAPERDRDAMQLATGLGEAWMDRCLETVRTHHSTSLDRFAQSVARHALERMQPQWIHWVRTRKLDGARSGGADLLSRVLREGSKGGSQTFINDMRQPVFARTWESRNATPTLDILADWITGNRQGVTDISRWICNEFNLSSIQGAPHDDKRPGAAASLNGVYAPVSGSHARVALFMRAIQSSRMLAIIDGTAPGIGRPVPIIEDNINDVPVMNVIMEVIQGLHGSRQILPDPDPAWTRAVLRWLDNPNASMKKLRDDFRWARKENMPDAEIQFRTFAIQQEVRGIRATAATDADAIPMGTHGRGTGTGAPRSGITR